MKKLGMIICLIGLCYTSWNGWLYWKQLSAVTPIRTELSAEVERVAASKKKTSVSSIPASTYVQYEEGQEIGQLIIPALDREHILYWGTTDTTLDQGLGVYDTPFTSVPSVSEHTAIAGHRDTSFRRLGELENKDLLYLVIEDIMYEYQIRDSWVTDAEDRTVLVQKKEPTLTLTTCYPFQYIGAAPDRYIVQATLTNIQRMQEKQ